MRIKSLLIKVGKKKTIEQIEEIILKDEFNDSLQNKEYYEGQLEKFLGEK